MAVWAYLRLLTMAHSWHKGTDVIKNACGQPHTNTRCPKALHSIRVCKTSTFTVQPLRSGCCSRAAAALAALPDCRRDDVVGEQSNEKFGLMARAAAMPTVAPQLPPRMLVGVEVHVQKWSLGEEMLVEQQGLPSPQHRWTLGTST